MIFDLCFQFDGLAQVCLFSCFTVEADATQMGGYLSHEYHYLSPIGEAKLQHCLSCGYLLPEDQKARDLKDMECSKCQAKNVQHSNGIEVGFLFKLQLQRNETHF